MSDYEEIRINKDTTISKGGLRCKFGLLQPKRFRVWGNNLSGNKKYIKIQGVDADDKVCFTLNFFVGSYKKVEKLQKEIMKLLDLEMRSM